MREVEIEKIFTLWVTSEIPGIYSHKSILTKISKRCPALQELWYSPTIYNSIEFALNRFSSEQILDSIRNYFEIISDDKYWYTHKFHNIYDFLLSKNTTSQFLSENKPQERFLKSSHKGDSAIDLLRKKFKPITKIYDESTVYNKVDRTYYGFPITDLMNEDYIEETIWDVKRRIKNDETQYSVYEWAEMCTASLLFRRKNLSEEYVLVELAELTAILEFYRDKFSRDAKRIREEMS